MAIVVGILIVATMLVFNQICKKRMQRTQSTRVKKVSFHMAHNRNAKVALVTTTKNAHQLPTWVEYHINRGFKRIYIFFDLSQRQDPSWMELNDWLKLNPHRAKYVHCIQVTPEWTRVNQRSIIASKHFKHYDNEVMSRQQVNAQTALVWLKTIDASFDIDYLLHIDTDELWYPIGGSTVTKLLGVGEYFATLSETIDTVSFRNWEVVPTQLESTNVFKDLDVFRKDRQHYRAYCGVKSAIRIRLDKKEQEIHGVHYWWSAGSKPVEVYDAVILHYVSPTFEQWFLKYKLLGSFPDTWFGGDVPIGIVYHCKSRDQVQRFLRKKDVNFGMTQLREWYEETSVRSTESILKDPKWNAKYEIVKVM